MLRGAWSVRGAPLKPRTVNLRVTVALDFLRWAALRELRSVINVRSSVRQIRIGTHKNSSGYAVHEVESRVGVVRAAPSQLRIPTDAEIAAWRDEIRVRSGPAKLLMVDLILATGIRREEAAQWRPGTLPLDRNQWRSRGDYVTVTIEHGTKGGKQEDPLGEEIGPARSIDIPVAMAERLHNYAKFERPQLSAKYVRAGRDITERRNRMKRLRNRLFLSDVTGVPVSGGSLYETWTMGNRRPFVGWSVHGGRHYWACKTLMERVGQVWRSGAEHYDLTTSANDVMLLHIKPQLGHVSMATTMLYLTWIERMFVGTEIYEQYASSLEEVVGSPEAAHEA